MTAVEMRILLENILERLLKSADWQKIDTDAVNLISFEVYPWHNYCALSLRQTKDTGELNPAEWELFEISRVHDEAVFASICNWYKAGYEEKDAVYRAHRIFTAAAYALCSEKSIRLIQEKIPYAPSLCDDFFPKHFYYLVTDSDNTVGFNYCEYIHISRLDRRLGLHSDTG